MNERSSAAIAQEVEALLRDEGLAEEADKVVSEAKRSRSVLPVVVVAGEVKRGKSTLVNALLGQRDLSPVGPDVVTSSPIWFHNAPAPEGEILVYGSDVATAVGAEEARRLASVEGNPGNERNIRLVRIGIPHPMLAKLELVDTPGVGGLTTGHGALTLQSLSQADALVFVIEAGAQFRAAELDFLRIASSRIDTVLLVLTKIDLFRGWRTVVDDNLRILREQAPRFADCPVLAVSGALALRGLDLDDPAEATEVREEAGFAALEAALEARVAARATVLSEANALRVALIGVNGLERILQRRRQALSEEPGGAARLAAERTRLATLREDRAAWPARVDTEIRRMTLERSDAVTKGTAEIRRRYEERVKHASKDDFETLPGELMADLTALGASLNEQAGEHLSTLVLSLLADIDSAQAVEESVERLTAASLRSELDTLDLGSHDFSTVDRLSILSSFSTGHSMAGLLTGSGLVTTMGIVTGGVAIAVGLGAGALYAFTTFRNRRRQLFATEFTAWMRDQCGQAQTTINNSFARAMIDVQIEIKDAIRSVLAEREREISEAIEQAKQVREAHAGDAAARRKEVDERLERVRRLRTDARTRLAGLGAGS